MSDPMLETYETLMSPMPTTPSSLRILIAGLVDWKRNREANGADICLLREAITALREYLQLLERER